MAVGWISICAFVPFKWLNLLQSSNLIHHACHTKATFQFDPPGDTHTNAWITSFVDGFGQDHYLRPCSKNFCPHDASFLSTWRQAHLLSCKLFVKQCNAFVFKCVVEISYRLQRRATCDPKIIRSPFPSEGTSSRLRPFWGGGRKKENPESRGSARAEIALNTIISLRYQLNDARDTVAQQSARDETENGMQHPSFPAKPGRKLCFLDGVIQKPSSP